MYHQAVCLVVHSPLIQKCKTMHILNIHREVREELALAVMHGTMPLITLRAKVACARSSSCPTSVLSIMAT